MTEHVTGPTPTARRTNPTSTPPPTREPLPGRARSAVRGAWLGLFVDFFDIYLPIVALAPATTYFVDPGIPDDVKGTLALVIFAASFLGRPLGSVVFGGFAERWGRRRTTLVAGTGTAAVTLLTAALPGYGAVGLVAPVLLVAFRLLGGIFMGGQYTGANPLAMEALPTKQRGLWGSVIAGAYPIAFVAISIITVGLLRVLPAGTVDSPYVTTGWRIPFVIGGLLTFAFVWYFHRNVAESSVWEQQQGAVPARRRHPVRELLAGANRRTFGQVFVMMTGVWLGLQLLPAATPQLLIGTLRVPAATVTQGLLVCNVVLAIAYPIIGWLGQRFGRKRMFVVAGVVTAVVTAPAYALVITAARNGSYVTLFALLSLCLVLTLGPNAMTIAYLCERFPTAVRSIGYGTGYSLPVIVPSFYAFFMLGVAQVIPYAFSPVPLLALGGVLTAVGAALGPATNDVDFAKD